MSSINVQFGEEGEGALYASFTDPQTLRLAAYGTPERADEIEAACFRRAVETLEEIRGYVSRIRASDVRLTADEQGEFDHHCRQIIAIEQMLEDPDVDRMEFYRSFHRSGVRFADMGDLDRRLPDGRRFYAGLDPAFSEGTVGTNGVRWLEALAARADAEERPEE